MSKKMYNELVKVVVDCELGVMNVDAEMHADQESLLLERGSKQNNLWGINLYPNKIGVEFIEFDSMINIRPWQDNRSRGIDNSETQKKLLKL